MFDPFSKYCFNHLARLNVEKPTAETINRIDILDSSILGTQYNFGTNRFEICSYRFQTGVTILLHLMFLNSEFIFLDVSGSRPLKDSCSYSIALSTYVIISSVVQQS